MSEGEGELARNLGFVNAMTMGGESNRDVDRSLGGFFGSIVSVRGVIAERLSV